MLIIINYFIAFNKMQVNNVNKYKNKSAAKVKKLTN
jgi:hypothetical protein